MDKRFMSILGVLVVVFVGIFIYSQRTSNPSGGSTNSGPTNNVEGQGKAGVTLIEYGDFECPICGEFYQPLKQVFADNSENIFFQFRNLPLVSIHPNAFSGARAADAAAQQGKFWQMHDKLYDNQTQWAQSSNPLPYFQTYAQEIGLNISKFNSDYNSAKINNDIQADLTAFSKTGQPEATPTFFLDGKVLNNTDLIDTQTDTVSVAKFNQVIANEIAAKTTAKK